MFDVSFSELLVIMVVALLVIGPEKLPKVARTLGMLAGRMQRFATQIREEVNREARFAELQQLQNEIRQNVEDTQASILATTEPEPELESEIVPKQKTVRKKPATDKAVTTTKNTAKKAAPKKPAAKKAATKPRAKKLSKSPA